MRQRLFLLLVPCFLFQLGAVQPPAEKRNALYEHVQEGTLSVAELERVLATETDPILRRSAVRLLAGLGSEGQELLREVFRQDTDPIACQNAFRALWNAAKGSLGDELLREALASPDEIIRQIAVSGLLAKHTFTPEETALMQELLKTEKSAKIQRAISAKLWPFHRNVTLLKDRSDWDHIVKVSAEFPLPKDGWAFCTDPAGALHNTQKPYTVFFDDTSWKRLAIGKAWEECGVADYDGYAWYRRTFIAPQKPAVCNAAELHFEGVDECAWVWLNGEYVGEHDEGADGWKTPFSLDVTDMIRWGEPNQITVRVLDSAFAGGIWKPVSLQIME